MIELNRIGASHVPFHLNPDLIVTAAQGFMNAAGACDDAHAFAFYSHDGGRHWRQSTPKYHEPVSGDSVVAYSEKFQKFVFAYLEFARGTTDGRRISVMTPTHWSSAFTTGNVVNSRPLIAL